MGNLRKYMPVTFATMLMGWLAICGVPVWAGFFSKDEILYKTFAAHNLPEGWNYVLWGIGLLTAVLTAVYMTRLMWMTFFGEERFHDGHADHHDDAANEGDDENADAHHSTDDDEDEHHALPHGFKPHESPWTMTVPLVVLAVLSTIGGLVGIPYALSPAGDINIFEHTLAPVIAKVGKKDTHETPAMKPHASAQDAEIKGLYASAEAPRLGENETAASHDEHSPEEIRTERLLAGLSVLLALSGIAIGIALFGITPLRKMPKILEEKWRVDELYNGYIVDPITDLSRQGLWKGFDLGFIDGIVNGAGYFVVALGSVLRRIQVGFVRSYAAIILVGALAVIGYFIYFGFRLIG
jgi:NADH-quinone oxidoreductase subunit L